MTYNEDINSSMPYKLHYNLSSLVKYFSRYSIDRFVSLGVLPVLIYP